MARWLVELNGDAFDIDEFAHWFPDGDVHAISESGRVYLTGQTLETLTQPKEVHEVATQFTDESFAISVLLQPDLKRPTVGTVFREADDGSREGFALASGRSAARSKMHATLTTAGEPAGFAIPTQAQELLAASRSGRHLQVAVSLLAIPGATWPHLYRCLEELEGHLGQKVSEAGLCSNKQRERLHRSANTAEVAGKDARHGLGNFVPPSDPMSLSEARGFISQVLLATLRRVARQPRGSPNAV